MPCAYIGDDYIIVRIIAIYVHIHYLPMWVQIPPSPPRRRKLHIACGDFSIEKSPAHAFRCVSFSAKGRVRAACSLVNALTTALAHYQPFAGTQGSCIFFVVPFHVAASVNRLRRLFYKATAHSYRCDAFSVKVTLRQLPPRERAFSGCESLTSLADLAKQPFS